MMQQSRRTLLRFLLPTVLGVTVGGLAGCRFVESVGTAVLPASADPTDNEAELPDPAQTRSSPIALADATPGPAAADAPLTGPGLAVGVSSGSSVPGQEATPGPVRTVAVPPTPTAAPPTPVPTATPRPRPTRALLTVPYYNQRVGRQNYCLPTSIAMMADRYDRLPPDVSGTPEKAPRFVADIAYRLARERIAGLVSDEFRTLWEEIGTDPLGGLIWDVFAPNGRDLAVGMSPALAYLVLTFAFGLTPVLGPLDECLVALADDVPSILFGNYGALRRVDGMPANTGGYVGDHAFVLVGIDHERLLVNDPLPSDKQRYSGERTRDTAFQRAVRFDLGSVQRMTIGDNGEPRGDCFMVPPPNNSRA